MAELVVDKKLIYREKVQNLRKYSPLHYHHKIELYYIVEGCVKYFINNKSFLLNQGDLIIVPKNTLHSNDYQNCLYNERFLLNFDGSLYYQELKPIIKSLCEGNIIHIPKDKLSLIDDLFHKIEKENNKTHTNKELMLKTYISELILLLDRYKIKAPENEQSDRVIQSVVDYISQNFANDLSLPHLSQAFNLSESYLSKRFKTIVGTNINEYINYIRITKAANILKQKKLPITQVAILVGFNDSNYFSAVFKKLKGITPYKYMKKYQK